MKLQVLIFKGIKLNLLKLSFKYSYVITVIKLWFNGVDIPKKMVAKGIPILSVSTKGQLKIAEKFKFNSGLYYNMIGRQYKLMIIVGYKGILIIGSNVGISNSTIVCHHSIIIGNNVLIGGNCAIYDTDFHNLDVIERTADKEDLNKVKVKPVHIGDSVFIGAHSTILKGVSVGNNSIIGACSVVTKNVPRNEVWAGNPAKFIKKIEESKAFE